MTARRRGPAVAARAAAPAVRLLLVTTRERVRRMLVRAWPRGRAVVTVAADPAALATALGGPLPDLVVVDAGDRGVAWALPAVLGAPLAPVAALVPRTAAPEALLALARAGVAELLLDGVDDAALRPLLAPHLWSARLTAATDALLAPHDCGALAEALWRTAVSHGGRLVRVDEAARALGVTREHLARTLAAGGAPGPKALLELVRLLAVRELLAAGATGARAAAAFGYTSPSHLVRAARRVTGTTPAGWAGLDAPGLVAVAVGRARAPNGGRPA